MCLSYMMEMGDKENTGVPFLFYIQIISITIDFFYSLFLNNDKFLNNVTFLHVCCGFRYKNTPETFF